MALRDRKREGEERVITVDSAMQGSLSFKDPVHLRINGKFEGTLEVRGVLEIGEAALVEASIVGDDILIEGKVPAKLLRFREWKIINLVMKLNSWKNMKSLLSKAPML